MKRISILLYTCCCLLSCSYKQENEIMKQQCEEWFAVERTYLYDNYQVGDSIFFIDENDSRQGFVIQKQTKDYQIEYTKGTLLMKSQEYISGLHLSISLQQEIPYFTSIDIYETYNGTEKVLFSIQHNNRNVSEHKKNDLSNPTCNDTEKILAGDAYINSKQTGKALCVLRKGFGIVRIEDQYGHKWTNIKDTSE